MTGTIITPQFGRPRQGQSPERSADDILMDKEAFHMWKAHESGRAPFSMYLPGQKLWDFRWALDRPLTAEDLAHLVGIDAYAGKVQCAHCGWTFQPVWWIEPLPRLVEEVYKTESVKQALVNLKGYLTFGAFYLNTENVFESPRAYCGPAYADRRSKDKKTHNIKGSHLATARSKHPRLYWGRSYAEVERIRTRRMQDDLQKVSSFFSEAVDEARTQS